MQIIPVLDIAGGIAVHAQAGNRSRYEPLESQLTPGQVGDAAGVLRAFHTELGIHQCYIADLDAIQGGAVQRSLIRELAEFLQEAADELAGASSSHWHRHVPPSLQRLLQCEVIVINAKPEL
jgi:uncharacterized protein related to proFAR isomerase